MNNCNYRAPHVLNTLRANVLIRDSEQIGIVKAGNVEYAERNGAKSTSSGNYRIILNAPPVERVGHIIQLTILLHGIYAERVVLHIIETG